MPIIAASILDADHLRLGDEIRAAEAAGVDALSFDVMDGHFVSRIELGAQFVAQLRQHTDLPIEVHLMIDDPDSHAERFCDTGVDLVTFHFEAAGDAQAVVDYIQSRGLLAGLALLVETDIATVPSTLLSSIDHLLILTVPAGWGGAPPASGMLEKIVEARRLLDVMGNNSATIEVDGGVKPWNCLEYAEAGGDVLVFGTAIFKAADYAGAVAQARSELGSLSGSNDRRGSRFLATPSRHLVSDPDRRERLNTLRASLDIPTEVWDPLTSRR